MTDDSEEAFLRELRATFVAEAREHQQALATGLVELESVTGPRQRQALIETVFRGVHSLKGAARAVENRTVEALCQSMEGVLSALKHGRLEFQRDQADLLHAAMDMLAELLDETAGDTPSKSLPQLCAQLDSAAAGASSRASAPAFDAATPLPAATIEDFPPAALFAAKPEGIAHDAAPPAAEGHAGAADTVRIATARLDSLVRQAEGLLGEKLRAEQRVLDIETVAAGIAALQKRTLSRPQLRHAGGSVVGGGAARVDEAGQEATLRLLMGQVEALRQSAFADWQSLAGRVDPLLEEMKKLSMLPVASALKLFPKMVRDLARSNEKEAALRLRGGEIEIDRRILDEMRDPLIHLVRNSMDHGIEQPAERRRRGKPAQGLVELTVAQREGGRVEIVIADDGAGIDVERVRAAARQLHPQDERELATAAPAQLLDLVFQSGVSTSPLITDLSGRGLGLAIVREKVERLGGSIELQSQPGTGTRFRIELPVTLATYRGVQVRCGSRHFVFPTTLVEQVTTVRREAIKTVENRPSIALQGRVVAVVDVAELLGLPARVDTGDSVSLVIAATGAGSAIERRIAFAVDEVVDEQEVLVKSLGEQLRRVRNIAGVARLRSGAVALILNVVDLMKSAARGGGQAPRQAAAAGARQSILVAEDSITSRMLLKGMLESVGYRVTVAVDGEDALQRLRAEPFDLVVSDVDMPRMNGLQLTARIRADSALANLPVILVTTLASVEDRERGAEVGASAYLVKSSFEQSNLLEVVRRLL